MSTDSRFVIVGALVLAVAVTVALRRDHASPAGEAPAAGREICRHVGFFAKADILATSQKLRDRLAA